jgi:FkbM family methyltransferase
MLTSRKQKDTIKRAIANTIFEKPLYLLKLGYDLLVMNKWGKNYMYDKQTAQLIARIKKDSNCIDIGCHKGDILQNMVNSAPKGRHFAFEPIPELYEALVKRFENVEIFNLALSTKKGRTKFYNVTSGQGVSGLKKRKYDREHEILEIDVEIDTLDNIIPNDIQIDLIKIDVEGGEFDVIMGGKQLILKNKPIIIFEFEKEAAEKYSTSADEVYEFFTVTAGMKLGLIRNWLNDKSRTGYKKEEFLHQYETSKNFYFIAYAA